MQSSVEIILVIFIYLNVGLMTLAVSQTMLGISERFM